MLDKILPLAVLGVAGAATAVGATMKKKNICPRCEIKKALSKVDVHVNSLHSYDNGAALTPPMGWSSWNTFRNHISEDLILEVADAMKASGLLEAGYQYLNLDDCWQSSMRDKDGKLQGDLRTFPSGIPSFVQRANEKGFKVGIYSSNGTLTCEDLPASLGHERIDAETFAEWGIEYFKYDFCHNKEIPSNAPTVDKFVITGDALESELTLEAENAELYGEAKIVTDENGSYITHLESNLGAIRFSFVQVPVEGEYILTIVYRKAKQVPKYAELTVNGKDVYPMDFPPTKAWSLEGRVQVRVHLQAGDNTLEFRNPVASRFDSSAKQYTNMGRELKRATKLQAEKTGQPEKPIVYSICEWGVNKPWRWGREAGNLWRTTPDIKPFWTSVLAIYERNVRLYAHAGVSAYNDPDMLEVGNGNLTLEENKSHFTLWCMMAAPLILGNDIRTFLNKDGTKDERNEILKILTNEKLIALDQDPRCCPCRRVKTNAISDVLVKPLQNHEVAVCLFNKGLSATEMQVSLQAVANEVFSGLTRANAYEFEDLWDGVTGETADTIHATVPSHGVKVYRVRAK